MTFALICPSRGRPDRLAAMVASAIAQAAAPDEVTVYAVLDADDPRLNEYLADVPARVVVTVQGRRETLSVAFQVGAERAIANGAEILMLAGDDTLFRTLAWDEKVLTAFAGYPDGLALIYPQDGNGNKGLVDGDVKGNHWFVTRRWVETVGYLVPPGFEHFCVDTVPEKIAQAAGRFVHLPDVLVEHMHFKHLKSKADDTYAHGRRVDEKGRSVSDRDVAKMAAMAEHIRERAAAVREVIGCV